MLYSYKKPNLGFDNRLDHPTLFFVVSEDTTETLIFALGVILCILSSIEVLAFFFKHIPSMYNKAKFKCIEDSNSSGNEGSVSRGTFCWLFHATLLGNVKPVYNIMY